MLGILFLILRLLLASALFVFLGGAFYLLWRDLQREARNAASTQIPALRLTSTTSTPQQSYLFRNAEVMVGRDPACDCHLTDQTISGKHARLAYRMSQWWVEDLQSTNGSMLNDTPVASPMVLANGDELRFGQLSFRVIIVDETK